MRGAPAGRGRVKHDLGQAMAIAQIREDQPAMVPSLMDPSTEGDFRSQIRCSQLAVGVGSLMPAHGTHFAPTRSTFATISGAMTLNSRHGIETEALSWEEIWETGPYAQRVFELLTGAQRYAVFVGWQVDSRIRLNDPVHGERFGDFLTRLCREKPGFEVFGLMWAHPLFLAPLREWPAKQRWGRLPDRVRFVFDGKHPWGACHHEKLVIVDGKVALCGGVDLCHKRWDTPEHVFETGSRPHDPYHDFSVQVTGPVVDRLLEHVGARWRRVSEIPFPTPIPSPPLSQRPLRVWLSRTRAWGAPIREVEALVRELCLSTRHSLFLEGQYYWSRRINRWLIQRMKSAHRNGGLRIRLILSPLETLRGVSGLMRKIELSLLARLRKSARRWHTGLSISLPYSRSTQSEARKPIYVHSKVLLVDDRYLSVGSTNFSDRTFRVDTELQLTLEARRPHERRHLRRVRRKLERHWREPGLELVALRGSEDLSAFRAIWKHWVDPLRPWSFRSAAKRFWGWLRRFE